MLSVARDVMVTVILFAGILALILTGAVKANADEAGDAGERANNVVIFVGDGMGTSHRDLIRYATVGAEGQLAMDSMPYAGRSETSPLDPEAFVTDSAAGATAIATGIKTFNGAVGVDAEENPVPTILEQAGRVGKATGLVTNSQVTDATPAAFGAHVADRDEQSEIARQYLEGSQPDVILGGGEDYWYPEGNEGAYPDNPDLEEMSQSDKGNLVEKAQQVGYQYVTNAGELQAAGGGKILGLFANETMFKAEPEGEGAEYEPVVSLPEMTQKAIETLSQSPDGFFLMVEEEGIDEMGHQSNAPLTIKAGQQLDEAVGVAKSYAESNPDTLVIVAADHETGGLAIEDTNEIQDDPDYPNESGEDRTAEDGPFPVANSDKQFLVDWTTANHTAEDVPVTAMGPGGEGLVGVYENTHIYSAMVAALGLADVAVPAPGAQQMPDTGGPALLEPWLTLAPVAAFLAVLGGLGLFVSTRTGRGARNGETR